MSWLFRSGSQSIGISVSASVLPMNIQDWFPLRLTGLIFLLSKGLSRVFSSTKSSKASILLCSTFFMVQLLHPYMTTGQTIPLTIQTTVSKVISLLCNMLSRFFSFSSKGKYLLISWLWSTSTVILEPKKIKCVTVSTFSPYICHRGMGLDAMI